MRYLIPLIMVGFLAGCSQNGFMSGVSVHDYDGPQQWPQGQLSTGGTSLHNTPVVYGLPDRPYKVVQVVAIPRHDNCSDNELTKLEAGLERSKPDALVLIGTRYDQALGVDDYLAQSRGIPTECRNVIDDVRANNIAGGSRPLMFLAVRWQPGWQPKTADIRPIRRRH